MLGEALLPRARRIVGSALLHMREQGLAGVVVEALDVDVGASPEGSAPHFEEVARETGTYLHYLRLYVENPQTYLVALSDWSELTDSAMEAVVAAWLATQERPL